MRRSPSSPPSRAASRWSRIGRLWGLLGWTLALYWGCGVWPESRPDFNPYPPVRLTVGGWPFWFVRDSVRAVGLPGAIHLRHWPTDSGLVAHEYAHVQQWEEFGVIGFSRKHVADVIRIYLFRDRRGTLEQEALYRAAGWSDIQLDTIRPGRVIYFEPCPDPFYQRCPRDGIPLPPALVKALPSSATLPRSEPGSF
jgi:hypothetical protein